MPKTLEFAYLQLYSRWSTFGGLVETNPLAEKLLAEVGQERAVAAALTDTFALAGFPEWKNYLSGSNISPIAAIEIGLSFEGARALPYALLLLAESRAGYANLCQLASLALHRAGSNPLTAYITLPELEQYRNGVIAISPYYGGPVMSSLRLNKATEAKTRAQTLRDIFGIEHFYLGVSPLPGSNQPGAMESDSPELIKLNAALVKLSRDLKIGLVGTGEARYLSPESANAYNALRGRISRAVSAQYPAALLHKTPGDWLYAPAPLRPPAALQLRPPAELIAFYNNSDWPNALAHNRAIAARCTEWLETADSISTILLDKVKAEAAKNPDSEWWNWAVARAEEEIQYLEKLGLINSFYATIQLLNNYKDELFIVKGLEASVLGCVNKIDRGSEPEIGTTGNPFEYYVASAGKHIKLMVARGVQQKLLEKLNSSNKIAARVAIPGSETGAPPFVHPRLLLLSTSDKMLAELMAFQPGFNISNKLETGGLLGDNLPDEVGCLELVESRAVSWVELTFELINRREKKAESEPKYTINNIDLIDFCEGPDFVERCLFNLRLWYELDYFAALLSLATPYQRTRIVESLWSDGNKIVAPQITQRTADCQVEDEKTIRLGLGVVVPFERALQITVSEWNNLDELARSVELTAEEWERLAWSGALDAFGSREQLAASAQAIANYSAAYHNLPTATATEPEAEQTLSTDSEQLSLFDMFGAAEEVDDLAPAPPPLELVEAKPITRLERLKRQYEALGCYTTEHPLWDFLPQKFAESAKYDPQELTNALAETQQGRVVRIVGLINGVRRVPIEAQGQTAELTILTLSDWSGQAELLLPPNVALGEAVLAEGEAISALVQRITLPGEAAQPALVAEAITTYPPTNDLSLTEEEVNLNIELTAATAAEDSGPPPGDDWSNSLFAEYGAMAMPGMPEPTQPPTAPAETAKPKPKPAKKPEAPATHVRRIHITLPRTNDPDQDTALMVQIREVLERFPGEDELHIYLPKENGGYKHFRPMTLHVGYVPDLIPAVEFIAGQDSIRIEE